MDPTATLTIPADALQTGTVIQIRLTGTASTGAPKPHLTR